jgi:cytochrome d ubiquinol oxidase subunit II
VNAKQDYTGSFWDLFTGYGVWTAVTLLALCLLHGATFLALRTTDDLRARAHRTGFVLAWVSVVAVAVFAGWTIGLVDTSFGLFLLLAVAIAAVLLAAFLLRMARDGRAFAATAVGMAATVAALFVGLYPDVLVSSTSPRFTLTVAGAASSHYALQVMTVVAAVLLPVVLVYQAWSYVVFRRRVGGVPVEPRSPEDEPVSTSEGSVPEQRESAERRGASHRR